MKSSKFHKKVYFFDWGLSLGFVIDNMLDDLKWLILRIGLLITDHCGEDIQIMFTDDLLLTELLEYSAPNVLHFLADDKKMT